MNDAPFLAIAGIWRAGRDGQPACIMLTTDPGPDVAPFHDRQVVVLTPSDWAHWIELIKPEGELLRPLPRAWAMTELEFRKRSSQSVLPTANTSLLDAIHDFSEPFGSTRAAGSVLAVQVDRAEHQNTAGVLRKMDDAVSSARKRREPQS